MADFHVWNKIHRLGKDEVAEILNGTCIIQEKIDGANVSIWLDDNGDITCGSRKRVLGLDGGFNGFCDWVRGYEELKRLFSLTPDVRLNGEWLVKHTIPYKETAYRKFYLFDITLVNTELNGKDREYRMAQTVVDEIAEKFNLLRPTTFATLENPTLEQVMEYVGKSELGEKGEGVVIKNESFINQYGDSPYAKIVTENFKEDNGVTFGGNNKYSDTYWEMYICNKYMTLPRVVKVTEKLAPELGSLEMKHIPRICSTAYHDLITEEAWEIVNKVQAINCKALQRICFKKAKQIFVDIINDTISVADATELNISITDQKDE